MSEAVPLDLDQMVLDRWTRRTGLIETAFESGLRGPPGRGGRTNCFARGRLLLEKLFAGPFVIDKARLKQDRVEIFRENFSTVEKEQGETPGVFRLLPRRFAGEGLLGSFAGSRVSSSVVEVCEDGGLHNDLK
jgi:hypothetical protein